MASSYKFIYPENYFGDREFLNEQDSIHTGSAKVGMYVSKVRKKKGDPKYHKPLTIDGTVEIRDCIKRIDLILDGSTSDQDGAEKLLNSRDKLIRLIGVCQTGVDVIESMFNQSKFKKMIE